MTQQKICVLGSLNVGKTSLVRRFVDGSYDPTRQTTIGVQVTNKTVRVQDSPLDLVIWDVYGENKYQKVQPSYLKNTSGYLLVLDGTRPETLRTAVELRDRVLDQCGPIPYVLVLNKSDIKEQWQISVPDCEGLACDARAVVATSAKTGDRVRDAFMVMATALRMRSNAQGAACRKP